MAYEASTYVDKKFVDLADITTFKELMTDYIDNADAKAIKSVNSTVSNGTTYYNLWKTATPGTAGTTAGGEGQADYIITVANGASVLAIASTAGRALTGLTDNGNGTFTWSTAAFDESGAAATAKSEVIGESTDSADADTIYGAKKYADNTTTAAIAGLTGSAGIASETNDIVTLKSGVTEADGKIANSSENDITLAKVAKTGKAEDVAISTYTSGATTVSNVDTAIADLLSKIGAIDASINVSTVDASQIANVQTRYQITQAGNNSTYTIDIPEFPVDAFVDDGAVKQVTEADVPYTGAVVGDWYIELDLVEKDGVNPVYIPANSLVKDVEVEDTDTIDLTLTTTASKNHIKADVKAQSIAKNLLTTAVQASLDKADSALQAADIATGATDGTISVGGTDVAVKGLDAMAYASTDVLSGSVDGAGSADNSYAAIKSVGTAAIANLFSTVSS